MSRFMPPEVGKGVGSKVVLLAVMLFLVAGLMTVLPGAAPSATAAVPTPAANEAVITVKVGGDRLAGGTVQGLQGVKLSLYRAGTPSTAPTAVSAVQGTSGTRYDASWSWTTCVSDAAGDCSFVIPIRAGTASATGVPQDTRFWVAQDPSDASPTGWYSNPSVRVGGFAATPDFTWGYRFRTDTVLRAGQTYRSTTAMAAAVAEDPDRGFLRNREDTNAEGGQGANVGRSTGIWSQSRTNPTLTADCGLDIAIVTDTSGSLGDTGIAQAKATMNAFVDGFRGTPTSMSVFSFSTSSPGSGATNHPALLPVTTATQAATFKAQYAGWLSGGGTSWDRGLAAAANSGHHYDLVVLLTDGNPTVFGASPGTGSSAFNSFQDIDAGIFSANQLKAAGSRVVALGVGPAITTASALNLRAISGTTVDSDYFLADDFAAAAELLSDLAKANCQGSIEVQKMIVPAGGTIADATPAPAGWQFNASTTATGVAVSPAAAATTATSDGKVTFGLSFTNPATAGAVQILETQQAGYELLPVGTGAAARNAVCVNNATGTPVPVAVTNAGTAATPGLSVVGRAEAQISCTLYNRALPPVGNPGFTLTKTSDPASGSTVRGGDTITYTVTGTNTGDTVLNPVTLTDDLSDVLSDATLTGTPSSSTGAAPTLSGTTLTWNGSLPVGGIVTLTYTVTLDADIPAGTMVNNHVEGSAQPPTTPENPVPPITPPVETQHPVPGFTLTKTSDPASGSTVVAGDEITYTVTGTNTGATALDPVVITDTLAQVLNNATLVGTPTSSVGSATTVSGTTLTWTGSLPVGGVVTLTYTVRINDSVPARTIVNNHVQGSAQPPTTPENPVPPITPPPVETQHPVPGFTLTKTSDPISGTPVVGGQSITYTVIGTNTGATPLNPVTITDTMADVLNHATLTGPPTATIGAAPTVSNDILTWTGSLPVGDSVVLTYTVTLDADVPGGTVVNNHVEGSAQPPTTPGNPPVPPIVPPPVETEHPTPGAPGFTLTKTSDPVSGSTVVEGDEITYTVTGTNTGNTVLDPVVITDTLAQVLDSATLVDGPTASVGADPVLVGTTLTWTGSLPIGGVVTLTYTVRINDLVEPGTTVNNHVEGSAQPPTTPENPVPPITPPPVETQHPVPAFTLTKTSDPVSGSPVEGGDTITYTVTGRNTGATNLDPVTITDSMADVLNHATLTGVPTATNGAAPTVSNDTLTWTGTLPVGDSVVLTYTVTLDADVPAGTVVNNHVEGSAQPPTTPENPVPPITPPPVETEHPVPGTPGFTVTKTSDPVTGSTVVAGDEITYTVTGTNTGNTVLDPVTLTDTLAGVLDNATLVGTPAASVGSAPVLSGTTLTWTGSLPVRGVVTLTYTVRINDSVPAGTIVNNHVQGSAQPPTTPENPVPPITPPPVETQHPVPGFELTKTADPASGSAVVGGDTITYTVTGTNTGATALNPVIVTDDLARVLTHATLVGAPTASVGTPVLNGTTLTWIGSLPVGGSVVLTYSVTVDDDVPAGTVVHNRVEGSAQPPTTPENPVPPITPPPVETEHPVPGLAVSKSADPASGSTVVPGQDIVYTLTFRNTGAAPATVDHVDDLAGVLDDADVTVAPALATGTGLTVGAVLDGRFTITGTLPVGETATVTYTVQVKVGEQLGDKLLLNFLFSTGTTPPSTCEPSDPLCTEHPVELPRLAYQGWKSSDPAPGTKVGAGQRIVYTLTVQNTGTVPAPVTLVDTMTDALDDATFNDDVVVSGSAAPVTRDGDKLFWSGDVPVGGRVSITYSVTVKPWAEQGNHHLLNLLTFPDGIGTCAPAGCTVEHPIDPPTDISVRGGGKTVGTIDSGLGSLPGGPNWLLVGGGLALLLFVGLGLVVVRRRRDSETVEHQL